MRWMSRNIIWVKVIRNREFDRREIVILRLFLEKFGRKFDSWKDHINPDVTRLYEEISKPVTF